jgi:hypothetical protein
MVRRESRKTWVGLKRLEHRIRRIPDFVLPLDQQAVVRNGVLPESELKNKGWSISRELMLRKDG